MVYYNGALYKANWWTSSEPGSDASWTLLSGTPGNPSGGDTEPNAWVEGRVYWGGDVVSYNGVLYEANWWTTAVPGSDASWKLAVAA
ncbi:MAG: hypothetical protein HUJ66_01035 [Oscillospiraceae bacterium]|nr:hypothetical protein [Oscillospiraceae bacterium]